MNNTKLIVGAIFWIIGCCIFGYDTYIDFQCKIHNNSQPTNIKQCIAIFITLSCVVFGGILLS